MSNRNEREDHYTLTPEECDNVRSAISIVLSNSVKAVDVAAVLLQTPKEKLIEIFLNSSDDGMDMAKALTQMREDYEGIAEVIRRAEARVLAAAWTSAHRARAA